MKSQYSSFKVLPRVVTALGFKVLPRVVTALGFKVLPRVVTALGFLQMAFQVKKTKCLLW
jgi:hypothetical protein